eukprot:CFRG0278T1
MASQQEVIMQERALVHERQIIAALNAYKQWRLESDDCFEKRGRDDFADSLAKRELQKEKLLNSLGNINYDVLRASKTLAMNEREMRYYRDFTVKIEKEIAQTNSDILELRKQLREENIIRRNKLEYDVLAGMTQEHPSRQKTMKNIEDLQKEIDLLNAESTELDLKLNLRKKQFHALLLAIKGIRTSLAEESNAKSDLDNAMET